MRFRIGQSTNPKKLLVITAMQVEEKAISQVLGASTEIQVSQALGISAKSFRSGGKELILVNSGIGIVNAGLVTGLVAEKFSIEGVVLLGVAGSIRPELAIGDLVIADQIIQHDSVFSSEDGTHPMAPGAPYVSVPLDQRANPIFQSDPNFISWLKSELMSQSNINYFVGTILSGSEFVGSGKRKLQLRSTEKNALAVEMESAGVALIARRLDVPFVVLKTIADRLSPDSTVTSDYLNFVTLASSNAACVVKHIWDGWTRDSE